MKCTRRISGPDLVYVVEFAAFLGPVAVAEGVAVLGESGEHDDDHTALLPHQLPQVRRRALQGPLSGDVGRVPRVVVRLHPRGREREARLMCGEARRLPRGGSVTDVRWGSK